MRAGRRDAASAFMICVDGSIAGPDVRVPDDPGGDGGMRLHAWIAALASWRECRGRPLT